MTADRGPISIHTLRADAHHLLKALRAGGGAAIAAAERFRILDEFRASTAAELASQPERLRLRNALTVIAREHESPRWTELKQDLQRRLPMYESGMAALLNRWFAAYEPARASLDERGGFLLPYRSQFFICESAGISGIAAGSGCTGRCLPLLVP
jgi:hypothetical protein